MICEWKEITEDPVQQHTLVQPFKTYLVTLSCIRFNIRKIYILPTSFVCFLESQNKERLFRYKTLTNWFSVTQKEDVYCAMRSESLNVIQVIFIFKILNLRLYSQGFSSGRFSAGNCCLSLRFAEPQLLDLALFNCFLPACLLPSRGI